MAYPFRNRNNVNKMIEEDSDNENGYDSPASDPDFLRPRRNPPRAAAQKAGTKLTNAGQNGNLTTVSDVPDSSERGRNKRKKKTSFSRQTEPETKVSIFFWLIFREILNSGQQIWYIDQENEVLKLAGKVKPGGILCSCCNELVTPQGFEAHACPDREFLANENPYRNMFLPRNRCYLQECMVQAWNHPDEVSRRRFYDFAPLQSAVEDSNDDVCIMCADGGDLFCCESCPSTFHLACMGMMRIPHGNWLCPYCVCKHCGRAEQELRTCKHCAKKYHRKCATAEKGLLSSCRDRFPFCGYECSKVHFELESMLGVKNALGDGFSWTLLQRQEISTSTLLDQVDIRKLENNAKIAMAAVVLNEVFQRTLDRHTQINILESVVYSRESNLTRINFSGFYVAVLENEGQMLSAATIRVHGTELAEMPYIGTRDGYRRQGMLRMLLKSIESKLRSLKVQKLVIPSVPGLHGMWTKKLSFTSEDDDTMRELRHLNALMFPSAIRLQKILLPNRGRQNQDEARIPGGGRD